MKKILSIFILALILILNFSVSSFAVVLDKINVTTDKTTVNPGENVTLTVNFGEDLGAYTVNVAYDNSVLEYVSTVGGTANDSTEKVKVVYFDQTGGQTPRNNMSVTFKAKEGIETSNPTELTVTLEGMANSDASITFDDITIPIVKNVMVEPQYSNYLLKLQYEGVIKANEEKDMKLSYSSSMGRYFEKARLVATAKTPEGGKVQLIGIDSEGLKHDIIQSGWGAAQGFNIGGKDYSQVLNVKGLFDKAGVYAITLKLIDRENSDTVIAENTFNFPVENEQTGASQIPTDSVGAVTNTPTNQTTQNQATQTNTQNTAAPNKLPKTGTNIYIPIMFGLILLLGAFIIYNRKNDRDIF